MTPQEHPTWLTALLADTRPPPKLFAWSPANIQPKLDEGIDMGSSNSDEEYDNDACVNPSPDSDQRIYIIGPGNIGRLFGPNVAQVRAAANRILGLRDSQVKDGPEATGPPFISHGDGMKIELDNIHFKYPTRDVPVFQGLSLTIEKGQFAALVGASGSGKSSIVSLLERFYDPNHGRILCNGQDIAANNVYTYRRHLSLVAQESSLFQGTLRENILLGVEDTVDDATIHRVCKEASIHEFIMSLPEGYQTQVGSRGVTLSGGQRQRVAIARALMRNPDILLLDEATSSLDSESEKLVQEAFERAGKGRTMVVVAHRLATVQNADVIFVLGEGKLIEKGSHRELLATRGVYWQMCQSQALDK
ncbi:hypothetical protein H9Q72_009643 [Fusarium xylarioides]|uniref:ABC transporter domain-containing protein n=1 Tax=Fusarium xylarioides TaxID=221167 RepID=A0A9P7L2I7_9HYPO|nr:hypothetical protein H9Q72_009643 [Fusarium xylarioides]